MDRKKAIDFIESGHYNVSRPRAKELIFGNLALSLMLFLFLIMIESYVNVIIYGNLLLIYIVFSCIISSKKFFYKHIFLSYWVSLLMMIIIMNFSSQAVLIWVDEYSVLGLVFALIVQLVIFFVVSLVNIKIAKNKKGKKSERTIWLLTTIWAVIVVGGSFYVRFINYTYQTRSVLLLGIFYFGIALFIYYFAQMLLKWYYCRKFNIQLKQPDNHKI